MTKFNNMNNYQFSIPESQIPKLKNFINELPAVEDTQLINFYNYTIYSFAIPSSKREALSTFIKEGHLKVLKLQRKVIKNYLTTKNIKVADLPETLKDLQKRNAKG